MTPNNVMIGVLCASPSTFHPLVCLSDLVSKTNDNVILKVAHGLTQKCKFRIKMTLSAKHMDLHGFHMDFIPASKNPKGQAHPTKKCRLRMCLGFCSTKAPMTCLEIWGNGARLSSP